ncbi:hypothetical protein AB0K43_27625 [Kitasatospora sp. NPDC049258]|uniref:hypothetical protein n=1 Tax=Kitasatospora sp. NPDC049258 TaxID=3155394 RepID=UPI00341E4314
MTVRVLAYEVRRLRSLRSTWLIVATVLCCDVATAAVLTRQLPAGQLSAADAVHALTALLPVLPLPIAALGAGVLGALSYRHEMRHPGLPAARVTVGRRFALLAAKLAVLTPVALALALVTLTTDALVVRLALPPGVTLGGYTDPALLRPELVGEAAWAGPLLALAAFLVLVVISGWAGLLITSVVRSALAGLLMLAALPLLLAPVSALALRRAGVRRPGWLAELMPFRYGPGQLAPDWMGWPRPAAALPVAGAAELLVALAVPGVALLLLCLLMQLRRRAF